MRSLRYKLAVLFAAAVLILLVAIALSVRSSARHAVVADIQERLDEAAEDTRKALDREIKRRGFLNDTNASAVVLQSIGAHPTMERLDLVYWRGAEPSGFSLQITPYGIVFGPGGTEKDTSDDARRLRRTYRFLLRQGIPCRLVLDAPTHEADRIARRLEGLFLWSAGIGLLSLMAITYALSQTLVTGPLIDLQRLTERVTQGELEPAIDEESLARHDEIGDLTRSLNTMLTRLREARNQNLALLDVTQRFNRELEANVQMATAALEERNRELELTNRALIEARDDLTRAERLAALGQLSAAIAHEIGTPLSTLSGYLQIMLVDPAVTPDLANAIAVASGEAERMTRIIRRFLDATRGLRPHIEPVDLSAMLSSVIELTIPAGQRERFRVSLELDPEAMSVTTDPGLLRQVLINLIRNAIDAMGEEGTLVIRSQLHRERWVLEVEDSGPGVEEANRDQIFTPFFTTKAVGKGTGLGLAISREIMLALRGTITLAPMSSTGRGARFILDLPKVPGDVIRRDVAA